MIRSKVILIVSSILLISLGCTYVSNGGESLTNWFTFWVATVFSAGILFGGWWIIRKENPPTWLGWLFVVAVLLRLGAALFWFFSLPQWGYGNPGEAAGYIMSDAFERDQAAWQLAQSDQPLTAAFSEYRLADQYGGFLFFSAGIYRFLRPDWHQPLLVVVITAAISTLSVIFTWAFASRLWGAASAQIGVILLAIYPEAILLGSSQMREALMISSLAIGIWGLVAYRQDHRWRYLLAVFGVVVLSVPLSSIFTILLVLVLIGLAALLDRGQIFQKWQLWVVLVVMIVIGMLGLVLIGDRVLPVGISNPIEALQQWLKYAAKWEARNAILLSGWMDKIFQRSPDWLHTWILLGYGTVQPFLPAAVIANGNSLWRGIAIWRAIGWTFLLFLLIYALFKSFRTIRRHYFAAGVSLIIWAGILVSAYRGGGDQWDNPRYRLTLVPLQVAMAGWVWIQHRKSPDPWLRRILVGMGFIFLWFVPWYLRRYIAGFTWSLEDLFKTLGVGVISMFLFWIWDWARAQN